MNPIQSLLATGTKLWLDSIDPDLVERDFAAGATGATSNPIIVADLVASGTCDDLIDRLVQKGRSDEQIAWELTDHLVRNAQEVFLPVWDETCGNDGYVSFEVDPLLEDPEFDMPHPRRVAQYIELARRWSAGHKNRLIKVPATPAGLDALEPLAAAGVKLNVTLIFSPRQYRAARDAIWRGASPRRPQRLQERLQHLCLSPGRLHRAGGAATLAGGPRHGRHPQREANLGGEPDFLVRAADSLGATDRLRQHGHEEAGRRPLEICRSLRRQRHPDQPPGHQRSGAAKRPHVFAQVDHLPPESVVAEIDRLIDMERLEATLMAEGIAKFAKPQKALLRADCGKAIGGRRAVNFAPPPSGRLLRRAADSGPPLPPGDY